MDFDEIIKDNSATELENLTAKSVEINSTVAIIVEKTHQENEKAKLGAKEEKTYSTLATTSLPFKLLPKAAFRNW